MATRKRKIPDLFHEEGFDPVETATGYPQNSPQDRFATSTGTAEKKGPASGVVVKKKAGFYLSKALLHRFDRKFYELKLAGVSIGNKSTLLEAALDFALDDIDKGKSSRVLKQLGKDKT
jgi:hypothetical protein